jgi:hypothetical protein
MTGRQGGEQADVPFALDLTLKSMKSLAATNVSTVEPDLTPGTDR